ncbi:MAG: response regulator transcription factor [Bacteroidia bacterium]|nr:response regulator transcription factor [Bacteroidia bacterium]
MLKLIIVEDHNLVRAGIIKLIKSFKDVDIQGEATNGEEAIKLIRKSVPDLVITDISMPEMGGIELIKYLKRNYPKLKILVLSMLSEEQIVIKSFNMGVDGYLLKDASQSQFSDAIFKIAKGEKYFPQNITDVLLNSFHSARNMPNTKSTSHKSQQLANREIQIINLISKELTNQQIADRLFISLRTVETHRRNLMSKLEVKNTAGLIKYAIKHKIISVD